MVWPISNHESPDVDLSIPRATAPHYLWAILSADGTSFRQDKLSHNSITAATIFESHVNYTDRASLTQVELLEIMALKICYTQKNKKGSFFDLKFVIKSL